MNNKCKYNNVQVFKGKVVFIWGIIFSFAFHLFADPKITGVSGVITDKNQITIKGAMFGFKESAAPKKYDNFESGVHGELLSARDASWKKYGNGAKYSNGAARSGKFSAGSEITNGESFNTNYTVIDKPSNELFISYWWKTTNADTTDNTIVKLSRIASTPDAGGGGVYNGKGSTTLGGTFNFSGGSGPYCAYNDGVASEKVLKYFKKPPMNKWLKVEMYKKLSTPGLKDGVMECRLLGVDYGIDTAAVTREKDQTFKLNSVLLGLMDGSDKLHSYEAYIDDIYIDNTRSRIEIGNAENWSACTIREVQSPTVWTDTLLKCSINIGQYTSTDKFFLYVVDSNGRVNTVGYPLNSQLNVSPLIQKNQATSRISCVRNGDHSISLSVLSAIKGDMQISVFDISGKMLWCKNESSALKSDIVMPLPITPFIVSVKQQNNNYSQTFCIPR